MNPVLVPAAIVGGTALSYIVAFLVNVPALVPFLNVVPAFPFMIASLRRGRLGEAVWRMLIWAAALAVCATVYRREMFEYLRTGFGPEGDIRRFVPMHLAHAAVFCGLAIATGSLLAMPLGALLMNYMAYYAGALGAASADPWLAMSLAWAPWAVVRVAAFVTLGVVLGAPVLARLFGFEYRLRDRTRWIGLAAAGLAADVALKWALAPAWRELLRGAAGW